MKIYEYENYNEYVAIQTDANKRKLARNPRHSFVNPETIAAINGRQPNAFNILCHGTRNGREQLIFMEYYRYAYVVGTEISDNANTFPHTIHHDFHEEKQEWLNKFDIIYSNSWDHSYDPKKSLIAWRNQLENKHGRLYLDHAYSEMNNVSSAVDPLEIYEEEIIALFKECGLTLMEAIETFGGNDRKKPCRMYVVRKNND